MTLEPQIGAASSQGWTLERTKPSADWQLEGLQSPQQQLETLWCLGVDYSKVMILGPAIDIFPRVSLCAR